MKLGFNYVLTRTALISEEPFGREDDHLDLDEICQRIRESVREIGEGT